MRLILMLFIIIIKTKRKLAGIYIPVKKRTFICSFSTVYKHQDVVMGSQNIESRI